MGFFADPVKSISGTLSHVGDVLASDPIAQAVTLGGLAIATGGFGLMGGAGAGAEGLAAGGLNAADFIPGSFAEGAASGAPEILTAGSAPGAALAATNGMGAGAVTGAGVGGTSGILDAAGNYISSPAGMKNVIGTVGKALTSGIATGQQVGGINNAANIVGPAYTQAGKLQSDAQLAAAQSGIAGLNNAGTVVDKTLAAQKDLQQPFINTGVNANQQLAAGLAQGGQFNKPFSTADMASVMPAFTFANDQAQAAMNAKMAAGGQNLSTNAIQGAGTLASGLAGQFENQAFNQNLAQNQLALGGLQNLSGTGFNATTNLASETGTAGNTNANIQKDIGQLQGAGQIGSASALSQGILGSAGAYGNAALQTGAVNAQGTTSMGNIIGQGVSDFANSDYAKNTLASILGG